MEKSDNPAFAGKNVEERVEKQNKIRKCLKKYCLMKLYLSENKLAVRPKLTGSNAGKLVFTNMFSSPKSEITVYLHH